MAARDDERFERLLGEYVDRLNAGESLDHDAILTEHPDLGADLLREIETFEEFKLPKGALVAAAAPPLGTLGDYTLRRQIGRGGMGVVYEAWQNSLDRQVALKVLPTGVAADNKAFLRFMREAKTAAQLSHQNIVAVYGMGVEQNTPYFAMEFVEGETLAQVLAKLKEAEPEAETLFGKKDSVVYFFKLADAFADVADGLQHAHSKGIIHRDIKPSNLILDREGHLRILDFGLARLEGQESLTISGDLVGTPLYMSPEQARRKKIPVDHRTDVYSLGATLYEMLAGRPPFRGRDHEDTLSQIIERDPVEPRKVNQRVPKDLETIVLKCLRKDAADRYGTAEAMAQDLRRFVRGDAIEARPQARWERLSRRLWRQRWRIAGLACAIFSLVAGAVLTAGYWRESARSSEALYREKILGAIAKLQIGQMLIKAEGEVDPGVDPFRVLTRADSRVTSAGGGLGPVAKAVEELERLAAAFPRKPDAHYHRAKGLLLLGWEAKAMEALDDAVKADRSFVPARILRSVLLEKHGDRGGALRELELAKMTGDAMLVDTWHAAYSAALERRWEESIAAYDRILDDEVVAGQELCHGSSLEARLGRGYALLETGKHLEALEDFISASRLWPRLVEPVLLKGKAYYLLGNVTRAEKAFQAAYRNAPFPDDVARILAILYGTSFRDFEKALAWAERMKEGSFRETTRAACLNMLGRSDEAIRAAKRAIELDPKNALAFLRLGTACSMQNKQRDALEAYLKAVQLDPTEPVAHSKVGYVLYELGRNEESLASCRKAIQLCPDFLGAIHGEIWVLMAMGRFDEAAVEVQKACQIAPRAPSVLIDLGASLAWVGNYEEAQKKFEEAVRLAPRYPAAYEYWGRALHSQGKLDEALAAYRKALELRPLPNGINPPVSGGHTRARIAGILEQQGQFEEAFREYCKSICVYPSIARSHERVLDILRRIGAPAGAGALFDELAENLEDFLDQEYSNLLETLALARIHGEKAKDLVKAREYLDRAAAAGERQTPAFASVLADLQFAAGEKREAVVILEEALAWPGAKRYLAEQLNDYRRQLSPDLVSYSSIDAALAATNEDRSAAGEILEAFRSSAQGTHAANQSEYLEARVLARRGDPSEAARKMKALAIRDPSQSEPVLRLAESLRAAGDPESAERELRSVLKTDGSTWRELWNLWAVICFVELARSPAEVLTDYPGGASEDASRGYRSDLRWLLETLKTGEAVRIDCGGEGCRSSQGVAWGGDRFFCGGETASWHEVSVANTQDTPLYLSVRVFPEDQYAAPAYRVPLPRGTYQVTLHFSELAFQAPGRRSFDVFLEEREVLKDYDLVARKGYAIADLQTFRTEVSDGTLDIEFVHRIDEPCISAIGIERIE